MKPKKEYFISGIDTDCGKTYITGHMAYHLLKAGVPVITTKLAQTGCQGVSEDIISHREIMDVELYAEDRSKQTCPFVFSFPASPQLAAEIDQEELDFGTVRANINSLFNHYNVVLSEGVGGLMVPLKHNFLVLDYIKEHNLPLILVSSSKLGSINHTLMSIEICAQNHIDLQFVVYNRLPNCDETIANDSILVIKDYLSRKYPHCALIDSTGLEKHSESGYDLAVALTK